MKNDGKDSESIFADQIKLVYGKEAFLYRITDTNEASRGGKIKVKIKATPSDYILTAKGTMMYVEVKSTANPTNFPLSCFTPGQLNAMVHQQAANGLYLVYIHRLLIDQWYVISGPEILTALKKKKSINWKELENNKWHNFIRT